MKKMSEVFELPLVQMPEADDQIQDANGDWVLVVRLPWRADYAAHAINHADALAEALEAVLPFCQGRTKEQIDAWAAAKDALAAYRGEA